MLLQYKNQIYSTFMDATPDCVEVLDTAGRLLHINAPGLCAMEIDDFGALCGRDWKALWPSQAQPDIERFVAQAVGGEVTSFEAYCPSAKGSPRWWQVTVSPIRDAEGGPVVRLLSVSRDITARKQAEERLRASEAEFRAVFEQSAVGKAQISVETRRFIRVNAKFCKMIGYSAEELAGMTPTDITFVEDRDADAEATRRTLIGETAFYETEKRYMRKDGEIIWVHVHATLLRDAEGRPHRTMAVIQDITARKAAEQALEESGRQFRQTVMNVAVPTLLHADDDTILLVNQAWTDITGYSIKDIPTISAWTQKAYGERNALAKSYIDALFDSEIRVDNGEWDVTTATGEKRVWHFSSTPAGREPSGRRLIVSTAIDITEQKQAYHVLANREAHLRRVINNQLGLVGVIDRDGILLEVDERSLAIAKARREQVIGKHFADAPWWNYDPEVAQQMRDAMRKALAGDVVRYDVSLFAHGAEGVMIDFMIKPVFGDDGEVEYLIPSGVDIRERYAAQQKVRESEERFRGFATAMPQLVWSCSSEGECTFQGPQWETATGQSLADSLGFGWLEMIHPDDRQRAGAVWQKAVAEARNYEAEYRLRTKAGTYRWFLARAERIAGIAGPAHWIGTSTDIDDAKRTAALVKENEQRMRLATEATAVGIWEWNLGNLWSTAVPPVRQPAFGINFPPVMVRCQVGVNMFDQVAATTRILSVRFNTQTSSQVLPLGFTNVPPLTRYASDLVGTNAGLRPIQPNELLPRVAAPTPIPTDIPFPANDPLFTCGTARKSLYVPGPEDTLAMEGDIWREDYVEETNWDKDRVLYETLKEQDTLPPTGSEEADFLAAKAASSEGEFYEVEQKEAAAQYHAQQTQVDALKQSMTSLGDQMLAIDTLWWQTGADTAVLAAQRRTLETQLEIEQAQLELLVQAAKVQNQQMTEDGLMQNQQISEDKTVEYFRKTVNEISLSTIAKGIYNFDETQLNTLQSIANTCPLQGGQAVYKARAILSSMEHTVYDDKAICDAVNMIWQRTERAKPEGFVVIPNPTSYFSTVWIPKNIDKCAIRVMDIKGTPIMSFEVNEGTKSQNIDTHDLPAGIYMIRLTAEGHEPLTQKLIVVKF